MRKIREEMEVQRMNLERILNPEDFESRMKEMRERERVLRRERAERIRARYEKSRDSKVQRLQAQKPEAPPPERPLPARKVVHLSPVRHTRQQDALWGLEIAIAAEANLEKKKVAQHQQVLLAKQRVIATILAEGVDRKGFVFAEATVVQQFARQWMSQWWVCQRRRLARVDSPTAVVLSLESQTSPVTQRRHELSEEFVRDAVEDAKVRLTKEYVMNDIRAGRV